MLLSTVNSWQVQGKLTPDLRAQAATLPLLLALSQVSVRSYPAEQQTTQISPGLPSHHNWGKAQIPRPNREERL